MQLCLPFTQRCSSPNLVPCAASRDVGPSSLLRGLAVLDPSPSLSHLLLLLLTDSVFISFPQRENSFCPSCHYPAWGHSLWASVPDSHLQAAALGTTATLLRAAVPRTGILCPWKSPLPSEESWGHSDTVSKSSLHIYPRKLSKCQSAYKLPWAKLDSSYCPWISYFKWRKQYFLNT